jgi:hypothetical protein
MDSETWRVKKAAIVRKDNSRAEDRIVDRRIRESAQHHAVDAPLVSYAILEEIIACCDLQNSAVPGDTDKVLHVDVNDRFRDDVMLRMGAAINGNTRENLTRSDLTNDFFAVAAEAVGVHFIVHPPRHRRCEQGYAPAGEVLDAAKRLHIRIPDGNFKTWASVQPENGKRNGNGIG